MVYTYKISFIMEKKGELYASIYKKASHVFQYIMYLYMHWFQACRF
jgi:hypothetical protein